MNIYIYSLICPLSGQIRYIGKTAKSLSVRLSQHISEAKRRVPNIGRRGDWIRSLLSQGLFPRIRIEAELAEDADWQAAECALIAHYSSSGADLINGTEGGDGMSNPSLEWRIAASERARGKKQSAETIAKRSAAMSKPHTAEWIANISAAHMGKTQGPHTDEQRAKISAGLKRYYETNEAPPRSAEQREKISAGLKRYFASIVKPVVEKPAKPGRGKWIRTVRIPKSPEHKAKIAAALLGRKHSPERRAAISAGHTGKLRGPRPPEVRAKISAGHRKRRGSDQGDLL